jgi:hypothetical protein
MPARLEQGAVVRIQCSCQSTYQCHKTYKNGKERRMYDKWDEFIGILANAISKYIDEMELDTLPDPEPINETSSVVLNKNMSNE